MARREKYSLKVRCADCGNVAQASFSENENPVHHRGELDRTTDGVGPEMKLGGNGPEGIICGSCGGENVRQAA